MITPGQTVTVGGTLILLDNSTVTVQFDPTSSAPISVSGSIALNGSLTITLTRSVTNGTIIPLISGSGIVEGDFDTVTVTGRACQSLSGRTLISTSGGVGVLITVVSDKCKSGLSAVRVPQCAIGVCLLAREEACLRVFVSMSQSDISYFAHTRNSWLLLCRALSQASWLALWRS